MPVFQKQCPGKTLAHCFHWRTEHSMLGLVACSMSMLIRDASWYNGHTGPVSLQATASVFTDYWSQALCILAWHQHVLGLQLLLVLKQMHNSGRSINPRLLPSVTVCLCHCVWPAQQMEHQPALKKKEGVGGEWPCQLTSMYLFQHRTNTGNTCWSLKFSSWTQKYWRAPCTAPPRPFFSTVRL